MKEYGELEKQIKKTLNDVEKRQKQLDIAEQEVKYLSFFYLSNTNIFFSSDSFNVNKMIINVILIINISKFVKHQNVYKNNLNIK